ncbi:hypothetical protein BRC89_12390 [Halobacteriales archaeon QS_4_70_19]|nr:MAG: hypothetical protein BRC89_12390 [Halobacteriales archaeon QS_4_70_19]
MTTVLLLRHGETTWNRQGRIQGWAPTPLTERGHEQARRAGTAIADTYDVDRVVASDLRRTRETTAEALSAGLRRCSRGTRSTRCCTPASREPGRRRRTASRWWRPASASSTAGRRSSPTRPPRRRCSSSRTAGRCSSCSRTSAGRTSRPR